MITDEYKERLRDSVRKQTNGEWAIWICVCGSFDTDPEGDINTCSFKKQCRDCIDWDEYYGNKRRSRP